MRVISFLVGVGVGAGLALLFAPSSGEEIRGRLMDKAKQGRRYVSDRADDVRDMAAAAGSFGSDIIDNQKKAVSKAAQSAKDTYLRETVG